LTTDSKDPARSIERFRAAEPDGLWDRQTRMRNLGGTLLLAALVAVVAAGCSSNRSAAPPTTSSTTVPSATVKASLTPKQSALALGARMLDEAVLPSGARRSTAPAPAVLSGPSSTPAMGNLVSAHRVWTVNEAPHAVWQWLQAHVPPGFAKDGTSSGTDRGVPSWGVQDRLAVFPANTSYAELQFGVASDASGRAFVRVDSQVGWTAPRPADEFVPQRDRVVTVTVVHAYQPRKRVSKVVVATDPKLVAPIVRAFNALRVSPPDTVHGCPPMGPRSVVYRVAFATEAHATPDLVASIGGCGGVDVTVAGRPAPGLGDFINSELGDAVAHVLGLPHPHFG
jgi:hypothetical protein